MVDLSDVRAAHARIDGHIRRTPVIDVEPDVIAPAGRLWFKLEQLQHTGSFKARGAFNRIRAALEASAAPSSESDHDPVRVIVAASGGNAGMALAHAARVHGLPAQVFVPENAPPVKVKKLRDLGADVMQVGTKYADAYEAATARAEEPGALFCHAYDQPEICAGQGTLGRELLDQTGGEVDTILLAVGGGGLMAGVAAAVEGSARVVAVEPAAIPTLRTALDVGGPVDVDVSGIAADSLGASRVGTIAYEVAVRTGVDSVLVEDADIVEARQMLWKEYRTVVEHGTASALAALLSGAYRPAAGERVAVVLCGANTDLSDLG
ncbi:threonine/serine dehydratase [Actinobacteria bacterium YIM 96077]|uniref:Threonine/serine dehydratase n=1 Tax=Phytoactinopolyspora halophila TaxID=1981511 RepID=A0A329QS33_9ACTN|nr:threonine/serine dehydratase [Phytoactinopolyspora halophila]AYY15042.1 threonine/serine dehydratase [Actinobacteria bacterium YIM 96077]RAW14192.1 threonine/serine dehydratase [Phytoactinopolyspora halophila]